MAKNLGLDTSIVINLPSFNALMQHAKTCNSMHVSSIQMIYSTVYISQSNK
jgi:hypothetical protein